MDHRADFFSFFSSSSHVQIGSFEHNLTTDLLNHLVFLQKVFMKEVNEVIQKVSGNEAEKKTPKKQMCFFPPFFSLTCTKQKPGGRQVIFHILKENNGFTCASKLLQQIDSLLDQCRLISNPPANPPPQYFPGVLPLLTIHQDAFPIHNAP